MLAPPPPPPSTQASTSCPTHLPQQPLLVTHKGSPQQQLSTPEVRLALQPHSKAVQAAMLSSRPGIAWEHLLAREHPRGCSLHKQQANNTHQNEQQLECDGCGTCLPLLSIPIGGGLICTLRHTTTRCVHLSLQKQQANKSNRQTTHTQHEPPLPVSSGEYSWALIAVAGAMAGLQ
jgi:hypothetical protein